MLCLFLGSVSLEIHAASWNATHDMNSSRILHTATLLPNDKVLIAGGIYCDTICHILDATELYEPATDTWTYTSNMSTARIAHTATLLPNGKVLVAGGCAVDHCNHANANASAEIYDPATSVWTPVNSMNTARSRHTATLLPNKKILVSGGDRNEASSAEVYDPATDTWTLTNSMSTARYNHTATLLPNGTVLVAGGDNYPIAIASAEVYDPTTNTWTLTDNSMSMARVDHTATLLPNGKVLVAGGGGEYDTQGDDIPLASVEVYDPATKVWTTIKSTMDTARYSHTATLLSSGKVLVVGGVAGGGYASGYANALSSAELYDPVTSVWTATSTMSTERTFHTATLLSSGKVLVLGGWDGSTPFPTLFLSSGELYVLPDFVVTGITLNPISPSAGTAFTAKVIIKNQGALAGAAKNLAVWLNQPKTQACKAVGNTSVAVGMLAPGAKKTFSFNLTAGTSGNKIFRAFVDSSCKTMEAIESNNQGIKKYTVN